MRHLFPWTRRRERERALAEAQRRQRADYDEAVARFRFTPLKRTCPFCPDSAQPFLAPGELADHIEQVHGIGEPT